MDRFTTKQLDNTYHVYDVRAIKETDCCDENNKNWFSLYEGAVIDKLGAYEDLEEQERLIVLPCKEGDTIYRIRKFCEENTGYKEFYRPSVEFENDCEYFEPICCAGDCERCNAQIDDDDKEPWDCSLNLDILCEKCKERFAIQKDIFTLSKIRQIFNTPMFNDKLSPEDIYYLSLEESEDVLKKIKGT